MYTKDTRVFRRRGKKCTGASKEKTQIAKIHMLNSKQWI